jgi:hypothetical protein
MFQGNADTKSTRAKEPESQRAKELEIRRYGE